jgi:chitodextrinase
VGSASGTQTAFSDDTVAPGTTYGFTVDAFDGTERSARSSSPLSVTTPALDAEPPSIPTGLTANATGATRVDLGWQASSDDVGVAGYTIYRNGVELATVGGTRTTFTDITALPVTTYSYSVDAFDASGKRSERSAPAEETTPEASPSDANVLMAAGDICPVLPTNCAGTAAMVLASNPDLVLALGDNQYEAGALTEYLASYDLQWGLFKGSTRPTPGNHEWKTPSAQGYKDYYGPTVLTNGSTWYSFDIGGWHVVSLDSQCGMVGGCTTTSRQYEWLQQDLAADDRACTLAFWHRPRFSSGTSHGSLPTVQPLWDLLQAEGAEVVLNGHEHHYERFAPQTGLGVASPTGLREFVVGTGGNCCYGFGTPLANSEVRITGVRGLLEMTLDATSYSWRFIGVDGSVLDSGADQCH